MLCLVTCNHLLSRIFQNLFDKKYTSNILEMTFRALRTTFMREHKQSVGGQDPNKKSEQKKAFRNGSITEATHWKNGILQASIYWRSVNQHLFFDNRVLIEMARLSLKSLSKLSTQQYCSLCIDHLHGLGQRHSLDPWKQL